MDIKRKTPGKCFLPGFLLTNNLNKSALNVCFIIQVVPTLLPRLIRAGYWFGFYP
jgi:hypothetical protein